MNLTIRTETPEDYRSVEELTRDAFWGYMTPTCNEHFLAHLLRKIPAFVPELNIVAEADGKLVGNIMYSKAKVVGKNGDEHEVLTFGPLSVLPSYRNRGVGSALMRHTVLKAKQMHYRAIVFYGHPDYYPRFGFRSAEAFHITTPDGRNFDSLMAMELFDGALDGISGAFWEDPVFEINEKEAEDFDRTFQHREPAEMTPIDVLLEALKPDARMAFTDRKITTLAWLNRISGRELLTWDGIDRPSFETINRVLRKYGIAEKLPPESEILRRAEKGIQVLERQIVK
jgi:predicted N-acetyltransferase YhbS